MAGMNRNKHIVLTRSETPIALKRSQLRKDVTDRWYGKFRNTRPHTYGMQMRVALTGEVANRKTSVQLEETSQLQR